MSFIHRFIFCALIFLSQHIHATQIEYGAYQRDSSNSFVASNNLDWLMWDVTVGLSINDALRLYPNWRLARNGEVVQLLNDFQFGKSDWSESETDYQSFSLPFGLNSFAYTKFNKLFGSTFISNNPCTTPTSLNCYDPDYPRQSTTALFGSDSNGDGSFNAVSIEQESLYKSEPVELYGSLPPPNYPNYLAPNRVDIYGDVYYRGLDSRWESMGVALVRHSSRLNEVPAPSTLVLMLISIIGMFLSRQQGG